MERKPALILTAAEIEARRRTYRQDLNPKAEFGLVSLGQQAAFQRAGVKIAWIAPGAESFSYHAHHVEEEWIYVLSGRAVCRIDGADVTLAAGDFVAFPAPSVAHQMRNPFEAQCVYLVGGERLALDVIDYPDQGQSYLLQEAADGTDFVPLGPRSRPYGQRPESG